MPLYTVLGRTVSSGYLRSASSILPLDISSDGVSSTEFSSQFFIFTLLTIKNNNIPEAKKSIDRRCSSPLEIRAAISKFSFMLFQTVIIPTGTTLNSFFHF